MISNCMWFGKILKEKRCNLASISQKNWAVSAYQAYFSVINIILTIHLESDLGNHMRKSELFPGSEHGGRNLN